MRRSPYAWVTWLTGHLAGDKSCALAPWYKAHYTYEKRPDPNAARLVLWKAEHADMVRDRVAELRAAGWEVAVEDQNKFTLRGRTVTLGGKPDIIARRGDEVRVEDCKAGQRRDSDYWQVVLYLLFCGVPPHAVGEVVYRNDNIAVSNVPDVARRRAEDAIRALGSHAEPEATPSESECAWCDIATCPHRVTEGAAELVTEAF